MKTIKSIAVSTVAFAFVLGLGGCADMNRTDRDTAIGAGAGALGGAVLTGGSPLGVAAGAVVGGVVGHEVGKR
jgi:osmotically inducible lipoprotein OsmB